MKTNSYLIVIAGVFLTLFFSPAQGQETNPETATLATSKTAVELVAPPTSEIPLSLRSRQEWALENLLDNSEHEFNYSDKTIAQIIEELREVHGIKIMLELSAVEGDLPPETPINFHIGKVSLRTGLTAMLRDKNAALRIDENLLQIISRDMASDPEYFRTRHFDCNQLLQLLIVAEQIVPVRRPANRWEGNFGGGGRGNVGGGPAGGGVFQVGENQTKSNPSQENVVPADAHQSDAPRVEYVEVTPLRQAGEKLIDLIQNHVQPDEWSETGQGDGIISILGGILTVTQSEEILGKVKILLQDLEQQLLAAAARTASQK